MVSSSASADCINNCQDGDLPAQAHRSLQDAAADLTNLADYCQDNYREEGLDSLEAEADAGVKMESNCVHGGRSMKETAEFAVRALQAVAFNVGVLAENFEAKLALLNEDVSDLASEVGWLGLKVDNGRERRARRQIRKLTVRKDMERHAQPAVRQVKPVADRPPNAPVALPYSRRPLDFSSLDSIGHCGVKKKPLARSQSGAGRKSLDGGAIGGEDAGRAGGTRVANRRYGTLAKKASFSSMSSGMGLGMAAGSTMTLSSMMMAGQRMPTMPTVPKMLRKSEGGEVAHKEAGKTPLPPGSETETPERDATPTTPRRLSLLPPMPDFRDEKEPEGRGQDSFDEQDLLDLPTPPVVPTYESHLQRLSERRAAEEAEEVGAGVGDGMAHILTQMDQIQQQLDCEIKENY